MKPRLSKRAHQLLAELHAGAVVYYEPDKVIALVEAPGGRMRVILAVTLRVLERADLVKPARYDRLTLAYRALPPGGSP